MSTPLHLLPFDTAVYAQRRARLAQQMSVLASEQRFVAVIPTAIEQVRNRDAHFDFRPDSYFYYLTGFAEPEAVLLLVGDGAHVRSMVFCREKNQEREIWDGYRMGVEHAPAQLGVDEAMPIDTLGAYLTQALKGVSVIFAPMSDNAHLAEPALGQALRHVRQGARAGALVPTQWQDVYPLIDAMRLRKDAHEYAWMREAGRISALGHIRAMQAAKVGLSELDLEAELRYVFMRHGAQHVAYNTIVATGENACVLHYRAGYTPLKDGDLCLIDAGAEYGFYAGDITRTFPVNGRFSPAQKALYECVLAAQQAAIHATRAGVSFQAPHDAALLVLAQGLLDLRILNRGQVGNVDDVIATEAYKPFFMHKTSHWLGLDVHDCGAYASGQNAASDGTSATPIWTNLESGMVLTIEPGLYIRAQEGVPSEFWGMGIRIEDDAWVTDTGCELLTRDVPVGVADIEYLMQHSS